MIVAGIADGDGHSVGVNVTMISGVTIIAVNIAVATISSNGPASPSRLPTGTGGRSENVVAGALRHEVSTRVPAAVTRRLREVVRRKSGGAAAERDAAGGARREGGPRGGVEGSDQKESGPRRWTPGRQDVCGRPGDGCAARLAGLTPRPPRSRPATGP